MDPNRNYLFCNHPHGFFSTGIFINFLTQFSPKNDLFPNLRFYLAAVDYLLMIPLLRDFLLGSGFISYSKRGLAFLLSNSKKGNVVNLNVGGGEEIVYSVPGQYKIILKRKKGFIKFALNLGCCLVPVIHFGVNDIFEVSTPRPGTILYKLQEWLKNMSGLTIALPLGDYGIPFMPKRRPITTIVGKAIELPKIEEITQEHIDYYHTLYIEELMKLFEEHKYKYVKDPENIHLIIV
ncbi:2-acylglycerol O-acyltransferase 2 isoform X2 [Halyomorpha halys]